MIILVMGVSGSGKTTIGKMLAEDLQWEFQDADAFHPAANIEKMSHDIPLSDADRLPWLQAMQQAIAKWLQEGKNVVLACSALRASYRQQLYQDQEQVRVVYLKGSFELIKHRLEHRHGHFMKTGLLCSQFDTLEEPEDAIKMDISQSPAVIVQQIRNCLGI
jgi:gluconokinase